MEAFRLLNPDPVALPQLLVCAYLLIIVRPVQLPYISEMASDLSNHVIYNSCRQCVSAPNGVRDWVFEIAFHVPFIRSI